MMIISVIHKFFKQTNDEKDSDGRSCLNLHDNDMCIVYFLR